MQQDEQSIRKLVQAWLDASRNGDTATVLSLMSDDVVFLVPGKEPFGKDAFAANSQNMKGVHIDGTAEIRELQISGDWAWMRNYLRVRVTPPEGQSVLRTGYTLTILRKQANGSWLIARDANLLS